MAYYNSKYQYETSPRKIKPEYEPRVKKYPKKSTAKRSNKTTSKVAPKKQSKKQAKPVQKSKLNHKVKIVFLVAIGFAILFAISYRNSVINEKFSEIKNLKSNLAAIEKENEQLEVSIENGLNLKSIEQSAKELLGMQKLENSQKVYVTLPKQDYIEPASEEIVEEDNTNWFEKIINFITGK